MTRTAESLLREILDNRDEKGNCISSYWEKRFEGLSFSEDSRIRSVFYELIQESMISVKWADNYPYNMVVLNKGIEYMENIIYKSISSKIVEKMKTDIERCRNFPSKDGSGALFNELVAQYELIFPGFKENLSKGGKMSVGGEAFDYRPELKTVAAKLEMILLKTECENDSNNLNQSLDKSNKKVFIVHGRDHSMKEKVEIFLYRNGLEPIILANEPNKGQTIIEKFEVNSDVSFAIILYTACDEGRLKGEKDYNARARQNVVFEHGYFCAKLGRFNVVALHESGVEIPSDLSGIMYIPMEDDWEKKLLKEFKASGLQVK